MDKYVYIEKNGYMIGLPARDMTETEWQEYPKELTNAALKIGLYRLEKEKSEVKEHVKRS